MFQVSVLTFSKLGATGFDENSGQRIPGCYCLITKGVNSIAISINIWDYKAASLTLSGTMCMFFYSKLEVITNFIWDITIQNSMNKKNIQDFNKIKDCEDFESCKEGRGMGSKRGKGHNSNSCFLEDMNTTRYIVVCKTKHLEIVSHVRRKRV